MTCGRTLKGLVLVTLPAIKKFTGTQFSGHDKVLSVFNHDRSFETEPNVHSGEGSTQELG